MANRKFYAVQKGKTPGIYASWAEAKEQVHGVAGAVYKSFSSEDDAKLFLEKDGYGNKSNTNDTAAPNVPETAYAFVDGSFNLKTRVYGYGGFLVLPAGDGSQERKRVVLQGSGDDKSLASMRNVAGEIAGAQAAIETADRFGLRDLTLFYDYNGIEQWATGGWQTKQTGTQEYAKFVRNYQSVGMKLHFQHVKGHSGIEGNELADQLAKESVGVPAKTIRKEIDLSFVPDADMECTI